MEFDVYFYAQSLDNLSRDIIFMHKESNINKIKEMDNGAERNRVLCEIDKTINNGYELNEFRESNQVNIHVAFFEDRRMIVIKINNKDTDDMGRYSCVTVLLDGCDSDFCGDKYGEKIFELTEAFLKKNERNSIENEGEFVEIINKAIGFSKKKVLFRLQKIFLISCLVLLISIWIYAS